MIFRKTVRGGLMLAALAGGCGDDDRPADTGSLLDAAMGDARFDAGSSADTGMGDARVDTGSSADTGLAALSASLQTAIRAACTKLNTCDAAGYPDVDACAQEFAAGFRAGYVASMECDDAYAAILDCGYMADCAVITDADMFGTHLEENCGPEGTSLLTTCTER